MLRRVEQRLSSGPARAPRRARAGLAFGLVLIVLLASACYKDAGENVQPTSNRVDLTDLEPTTMPSPVLPTQAPSLTATESAPEPADPAEPTATRTLRPTITPAEALPGQDDDAGADAADDDGAGGANVAPPTATATRAQAQSIPPTFTPIVTAAEGGVALETPGMTDIEASATPAPTLDPTQQLSVTPVPPEDDECVHVVQPNDTLYSIAQDNGVLLTDLVAANAALLGGSEFTPLQIGWALQLPDCGTPDTAAEDTGDGLDTGDDSGDTLPPADGETPPDAGETGADGQRTHVVQAGETIFAIGRQYGVDPYAIISANNLANPNLLQPGQVLVIPAQ